MSALSIAAQGPGRYIHWGVIQISVANLTIIAVMVLLFILALVVPFPTHDEQPDEGHSHKGRGHEGHSHEEHSR